MASIAGLTENAEGGANGDAVSTANSIFDNVLATNPPVFSTAQAIEGTSSIAFLTASTSIVEADLAGIGDLYLSYYFYVAANSSSNTAVINVWGDGKVVKIMDLRMLVGGTVPQLRSVNSAAWSGTALALNSWHRFDIRISPANDVLRVRIFSGSNRHGTTPDQDSNDQILTAAVTTVDNIRFGQISADASLMFYIDRIRGDDATYPTPVAAANATPIANAGPDQTVTTGSVVTLTGTASADPDGTIASYAWTQTSGTAVTLNGSGSNRTFTPGTTGTRTFSLVVTDNVGLQSTADTVSITVNAPANVGPTANAGPDQSVVPYQTVSLSGAGSTDSDGTIASYSWTQTAGPAVALVGSGASRTFRAPPTQAGTSLTFSLTVTDNGGLTSSADTVVVAVSRHNQWVVAPDGVTRLPRRRSIV